MVMVVLIANLGTGNRFALRKGISIDILGREELAGEMIVEDAFVL